LVAQLLHDIAYSTLRCGSSSVVLTIPSVHLFNNDLTSISAVLLELSGTGMRIGAVQPPSSGAALSTSTGAPTPSHTHMHTHTSTPKSTLTAVSGSELGDEGIAAREEVAAGSRLLQEGLGLWSDDDPAVPSQSSSVSGDLVVPRRAVKDKTRSAAPSRPANAGRSVSVDGVTIKDMLEFLVASIGFEELFLKSGIRCFQNEPSVGSSLKALRKPEMEWARKKIEFLYVGAVKRKGIGA